MLFSEVEFKNCKLSNRIVRSATNDYAGNLDGTVSEKQISIYNILSKNQVGLIITGHYAVSASGRNDIHQNALWDDSFIKGHEELTSFVHQNHGKIIAQINHAGAKSQKNAIIGQPVAPSAVESTPGVLPRALSVDEILTIEEDFAAAALRAQKAGYDGVQIHCAHGYLFSQFIDAAFNKRTDSYGGCGENRFRIVQETIQRVKRTVGEQYPIFLKMHINVGKGQEQYESEELLEMLQTAQALGIEAVELSGWDFAKKKPKERLYYYDEVLSLRKKLHLPMILVGGIRTLEEMERVLQAGIDMVSMSRPFICQPDAVLRLQKGEVLQCMGCYGCFSCYQKSGKHCVQH